MEIEYREHIFTEKGILTNLTDLTVPKEERLSDSEYRGTHRATVLSTHDAVVDYNGKLVLMRRKGEPLDGFLWLPGGRMQRGIPTEQSLALLVKRESGLDIYDLKFAGVERAFMRTDPLGHGKGTDTFGPIYFAKGRGELRVNDPTHSEVLAVSPQEYASLRERLHSFVQKYTDNLIARIATSQI